MTRLAIIALSLSLSLTLTLFGLAAGQSSCTQYVDPNSLYNVTVCPLSGSTLTPIPLTNPLTFVPTDGYNDNYDDGYSPSISLPFPVHIYGLKYTSVSVGTNGGLMFGPTPIINFYWQLPIDSSSDYATPIIAPLSADLIWDVTLGNITYATQGTTVGQRQFIVRYSQIQWFATNTDYPNTQLSFDVIFNEARVGVIEIRYYRFDPSPGVSTPSMTVGVQAHDDGFTSFALFNGVSNWTLVQSTLFQQSLAYTFIGVDIDGVTTCGALGYDLTALMGVDLNYTDSANNYWYYRPCGVVGNTACQSTGSAMLCQLPGDGSGPFNAAVYTPREVFYQYNPANSSSGLVAIFRDGSYCDDIGMDAYTQVTYACNASATAAYISTVSMPTSCYYAITVKTALVCGRGNRDTPVTSTLTACSTLAGSDYTGTLCPRNASSTGYQPLTQTNPIPVLTGAITNTVTFAISIGFPFHFYGQNWPSVYIALNGILTFNQPYSFTLGTAPNFGLYGYDLDCLPMIAAFGTSLSLQPTTTTTTANITYSLEGTAPNRYFVVRYTNVPYYSYNNLPTLTNSFDIILYEGQNGKVDIRYYDVSANIAPSSDWMYSLAVGVHGDGGINEYTVIQNFVDVTPTLAKQLSGTTLTFTYTGVSSVAGCVAYGANFTAVTTSDLIYLDNSKGYQYSINPCSVLTNNPCNGSSPSASVCQSCLTGSCSYALSVYNPSSMLWSPSPSPLLGVRSTVTDGAYCDAVGNQRQLIVDWICDRYSSITRVLSLNEVTTCVYNVVIATPVACTTTIACQTTTDGYYNATLCPQVPPQLVQTNPVSVLAGADDDAVRVSLPFLIHSFGVSFDYLWIGSNGVLSFGRTGVTSVGLGWPLSFSNLDSTPVIAAYWTDLMVANSGLITYSNETINGQRVFVVRYQSVDYWGSTTLGNEAGITFDVLLYEGLSGQVEIRYYNCTVPTNQGTFWTGVTVGLMSDDDVNYITLANNAPITAALAQSYSAATAVFTYFGPDVLTAGCGALGYNLSSLASQDLTFNVTNYLYTLRVCGVQSNSVCQSQAEGERSMLCQMGINSTGFNGNMYSLGTWNPGAAVWQYQPGTNGLTLIMSDGQFCDSYPRTSVIRFNCDPSATMPLFTSLTESPSCVYNVNVTTDLVCGPGLRYNTSTVIPGPAQSTLTSCVTTAGSLYNAVLCPRLATDIYAYPMNQTNPIPILQSTDNGLVLVSIPFPFYFYDILLPSVWVTTNGLLQFGLSSSTSTGANALFPGLGFTTTDYFPLLAPFWTDLVNGPSNPTSSYDGSIQYSYEGVAPNRQLVIRFTSVDYYAYRFSVWDERAVSFDVVLTEGEPGGISVRYYTVPSNLMQTVLIGVHGLGNSSVYTAVQNAAQLTPTLTGQLTGSTLTFTYTGRSESDFCSGVTGGFNFSSMSNSDLSYSVNGYIYYLRPCGTVTNPKCLANYATARVSVCQASGISTATYPLAIDNPSATVYSFPADLTVRATMADGGYCDGFGPRTTMVDYICNSQATTPVLWAANEVSTCAYQLKVNTSLTCPSWYLNGGAVAQNCSTYTGPYYTGRLCLPFNSQLPATQTNPVAVLAGSDDDTIQVPIPFDVHLYGEIWRHVWISANGFLLFGATSYGGLYSDPFPYPGLSDGLEDSLPIIAAYQTDLYNANRLGTASITYSTEGTAPTRTFVVKWSGLNYFETRPDVADASDVGLSFEVHLYEGTSGMFDVIYTNITASADYYPTIGVMSNDLMSYTAINNGQTLFDSGLSLTGYAVRYTYNGLDVSTAPCGGLGYNFTGLMGSDLSYLVSSTSTSNNTIYYNVCGVVSNSVCASQMSTERAMACAVTLNSDGSFSTQDLAIYSPATALYLYTKTGVQQFLNTVPQCADTGNTPGVLYTDFVCDPTAITPRISAVNLSPSLCLNYIYVNTSAACGGGNRASQNTTVETKPKQSTLIQCFSVRGANYNAQVCPRNTSDPYYYPQSMTSPTAILVGADTGVATIDIGFNFKFYGIDGFTRVNVSVEGLIQFGADINIAPPSGTLVDAAFTRVNEWPALAAAWADYSNVAGDADVNYTGSITYSHEGTAPNRQLIIRFNTVNWAQSKYYPLQSGVSFDVVLTEAPAGTASGVEVRYYRMDSNPAQYIVVGVHGDDYLQPSYTSVYDYVLATAATTNQLQGSTIRYTYTGLSANQACGAFGYSLLSASGVDVNYTNPITSRTYYFRVCGSVQVPVCTNYAGTQHSSLCETTTSGQPLVSVTLFNPSGITWTQFPGGLTSVQQDGTYCTVNHLPRSYSAPRQATINYLCEPSATTPVLVNVTIPTTCIYVAYVNTNAVCQLAPVPSSSSSSTGGSTSSSSVSSSGVRSSSSSSSASVRSSSTAASSSSSTAPPSSSSSSSSSAAVASSSSSSLTAAIPSSSTASFGTSSSSSSSVPLSATMVTFTIPSVTLPNGVSGSNLDTFKNNFVTDVANNLIAAIGANTTAASFTPFIAVTAVGAFPGARRLLQTSTSVTLSINDDISLVTGESSAQLAQALATRIANGQFVVTQSGASVPAQTVSYTGQFDNSQSSSSSSLSGGAIAGIVIGCVVGSALLFLLAFLLCVSGGRSKGFTKDTNEGSSNADAASEHSQHPLEANSSDADAETSQSRVPDTETEIELQEV